MKQPIAFLKELSKDYYKDYQIGKTEELEPQNYLEF